MEALAGRKTDCNAAGKTPQEKFFQSAMRCGRSCSGVFSGADGGKERFFACAGISAACLLCVCAATIGQSSRSGDALKPFRQPEALRGHGRFCRRSLRGGRRSGVSSGARALHGKSVFSAAARRVARRGASAEGRAGSSPELLRAGRQANERRPQ